ncbi:MAG: hypothetical protein HYU86_07805 [Chloroflexi bacterium]|nr:hypothetical protein [Chloroflexota bacterium]
MSDTDGLVGNPRLVVTPPFLPEEVHIVEDKLLYSKDWDMRAQRWPLKANIKGMLDHFVRIRDGQGVLQFARRYGALEMCEHDLPASHNPFEEIWMMERQFKPRLGCLPRMITWEGRSWYYDPIPQWFYSSRQARAILNLAAQLHQGEPTSKDDWAALYQGNDYSMCEADRQWRLLLNVVNGWLSLANARPCLVHNGQHVIFALGGGGTYTALAVQLMLAVTRSQDLILCSGCGHPYLREGRRPKSGQRNYCPDCHEKGVPARERKRAQRMRQRGEDSGSAE